MSIFPAAKSCQINVASPRSKGAAGNSGVGSGQIQGLGPMTRVTTAFGQVHAHTLRKRDRVKTKTGAYLEITRIDRMILDADFMQYHPGAQPILIRAGAFGRDMPTADVLLAPFQKLDPHQPFVAANADKAIDTLHKPHVSRKSESMITYTRFHCDKPATVCCEGLWLEMVA